MSTSRRHRGVGLGARAGGDAVLVEVAADLLAALPAGGVLPARGAGREVGGQPHRREHLLLLRAQALGVEGDRLLHRGERHQLQEVVLDDVARGADAVVVAGAAADADVLGHGDLHVVDVVGVPDRLEHLVGEAQRQQVLHRLLAEVVVDAEDRVGGEDVLDDGVELARRLQVVAERLLDDDPPPRPRRRVESPERSSCWQTVANDERRDRQVEGVVAAGAALLVELGDHLGEQVEGRRRRRSVPGTKRMPSASVRQTSSRNGVRARSRTDS